MGILYTVSVQYSETGNCLSSTFGSDKGRENRRKETMRLPPFECLSPRTMKEALEMLGRYKGKVRIVAGGTDIINRLRQRLLTPPYVMTLKGVPDLRGIKRKKGRS